MDSQFKVNTFKQLLHEIRPFSPRSLLPLIALAAADQTKARADDPGGFLSGGVMLTPAGFQKSGPLVTPWGLAGVAREVLVYGEGGQTPTMQHVHRLCSVWGNQDDPIRHPNTPGSGVPNFLVRVAFEQFRCQLHPFEEVARTRALYLDAAASVPKATLLSASAWEEALGCPLDDFVRAAFLLHVWAAKHGGWVDLGWLDRPQFREITDAMPAAVIRKAVTTHLSCSRNRFRKRDAETLANLTPGELRRLEKYRFNPLEAWPLVQLAGQLIAPQPILLLDRVSSTGIYYDRCQEPGFTTQLGWVFEHYINSQLDLIPNVQVVAEFEYDGGTKKSVDRILIFPELVLLVDAKATRLRAKSRMGISPSLDEDVNRTIVKAHGQIEATAKLIRDKHPAVAHVPRDRPMLGVVATLERYWTLGSFHALPRPPGAKVPLIIASSREIENLVSTALDHPVGPLLKSILGSSKTGGQILETALANERFKRNPLLDAAWDKSFEQFLEDD